MKPPVEVGGRIRHSPPKEEPTMFKARAMVHSLQDVREVNIVEKTDDNQYVAEFEGTYATAIFNPFRGLYYVDDIYGKVENYVRA